MKCLDWVSSRVRHTLHYGGAALTMIGGGLEGFVEGAKSSRLVSGFFTADGWQDYVRPRDAVAVSPPLPACTR